MNDWLNTIYEISDWEYVYESENAATPHSLVRFDGWRALYLYMDSFINNKMCEGYSVYRGQIDTDFIEICDEDSFARRYRIETGDAFYLWDEKLILSLTGDGASNVKNTPSDVYNMCIAFLKVFAFEPDILQCRHAGIPVLLSALPDKDDRVANYMQEISASLGFEGTLNIWSNEYDCWFLFDYRKYSTGDWAWQAKMCHMAVSAAGGYSLVGGTHYKNGFPYGLLTGRYVECLIGTRIQPYEIDKLNNAIENGDEFYTLTTNAIVRYWGTNQEEGVARRLERSSKPGPWTDEYIKSQRLLESKKQGHGILKLGAANAVDFDGGVFDVCHCMWAIVVSLVVLLIQMMWCVWGWTDHEIIYTLTFLGAPTIVDQTVVYLRQQNKGKNPKIWPKLHTTGLTNKIMWNGFHHVLVIAASIAQHYEQEKNDSNHTVTYLLAIFWRVAALLKEGFGILFTCNFEKPSDNSRPPKIQRMIDCFQLATFIAWNLCDVMVCVFILIFMFFYYFLCFCMFVYVWFMIFYDFL